MKVAFTLNGGTAHAEGDPWRPLLDVLREDFDLVAAKSGCGVGRCGACVVLVGGVPVNACLVPLARLEGETVVSPEGLDPIRAARVVDALRRHHVAQCGYCMNGLVVSLVHALDSGGDDPQATIREAAVAHLCRCGGLVGLERALPDLISTAEPETRR